MRNPYRTVSTVIAAVVALTVGIPGAQGATANAGAGYWMLGEDGTVYPFGSAQLCGDVFGDVHEDVYFGSNAAFDIAPTPDGRGYWTLTSSDSGHAYIGFHHCDMWDNYAHPAWDYETNNNIFNLAAGEIAVSISPTPDGTGYWVFTDRGRAIPFGSAQWFGDMSSVVLNGPILDSVATPSGRGYWMVASDGGIFSFGDARFYGSMGGQRLNAPVMSMAPDPDGAGYWLVASDGGIFAFSAPFYGSMGGSRLNEPISGIVGSPTGGGYLMVAFDGGIFAFGDVPFHGSLGANPPAYAIASVAVMP